MEQSVKKVEQAYNLMAKLYADKNSNELDHKPKDRDILKKFSEKVQGKNPVWDFGCGPGQIAGFVNKHGINISGLDLSEMCLQQARMIHPGIHFQRGNMLNLDFSDKSIGGIVSFYAIVHFTQQQAAKAFSEMFRVLKPGGVLLFSFHIGDETIHIDNFFGIETDLDFMYFTTEFIINCLQDTGFNEIVLIKREPYPEVEYQSKRAYIFTHKPDD